MDNSCYTVYTRSVVVHVGNFVGCVCVFICDAEECGSVQVSELDGLSLGLTSGLTLTRAVLTAEGDLGFKISQDRDAWLLEK